MSTVNNELVVLSTEGCSLRTARFLEVHKLLLSEKALRSYKALDLGGTSALLVSLDNLTTDNEVANIIVFVEFKELANARGTLGSKATRELDICDAFDRLSTTLRNGNIEDRDIRINDATADGATDAFAIATSGEALGFGVDEKSNTTVQSDTLVHSKPLFVMSTSDLENVSLILVIEHFTIEFLSHAFVDKRTAATLIFNQEGFFVHQCWDQRC